MKKIVFILFILFFMPSLTYAKTQQEAYKNDYLYSEAYFDYLIECAEKERDKQIEEQKNNEIVLNDEIETLENTFEGHIVEPFKLKIENELHINPYKQSFQKVNSKTIIPVDDKFSFIQNTSTSRNKYSSNDYKILAGAEYKFNRALGLAMGLETNYRGIDQNPTSRKVYVTPCLNLGDKVSLNFYNKMNIQNYSTDHDVGLNISPLKSKAFDFGVYAGITRNQSGALSESINFSTNFFFF